MKTAIISINKSHFNVEAILAKNNAQRIEWYNALAEDNVSINDSELCTVYPTVGDFVNEYNECSGGSYNDYSLVTIDYSEIKDGKMLFNKYDFYDLTIRFCAKTHEAERTKEEYQDMANKIYNIASAKFGTDVNIKIYGYYNDVTDYRFDIYVAGEKCRILNNIPFFCTEVGEDIKGMDYCEPEWSMDGHDIEEVEYEMDEDEWLVKSQSTAQLITPLNIDEYNRQVEVDKAIERANEALADCCTMLHNCKNLQEVYEIVDGHDTLAFGANNQSEQDELDICYKNINFNVMSQCDGGIMIAGDRVEVFDDNDDVIYTGYINVEGVTGVASQDEANIYLQPDEPEQTQEEDELDLSEYCPMSNDGESCFMLDNDAQQSFYLSVFVDKSYDQFSWKLYDENFKFIHSDWSCGLFDDTWTDLLKPKGNEVGKFTGRITFISDLSPKVFHHLIQA